jgi:predicted P-loop ATPase
MTIKDIKTKYELKRNPKVFETVKDYEKERDNRNQLINHPKDGAEWKSKLNFKIDIEIVAVRTADGEGGYEPMELKRVPKDSDVCDTPQDIADIIENCPYLGEFNNIWYDSFEEKPMVGDREMDEDYDPVQIYAVLSKVFGIKNRTDVNDAIKLLELKKTRNPVQHWMMSVYGKWDGEDHLGTFLQKYYGAEESPLISAYFTRWMLALVVRVFEPGAKFDNWLVLTGEQGGLKTTLFSWLGRLPDLETMNEPRKCYTNDLPYDVTRSQDLIYASRGAFIMTRDDFDDICAKDKIGQMKSFATGECDVAALKWKHGKEYPRHFVLAGTTNKEDILIDDTTDDERRFWVVKVNNQNKVFDIPAEEKIQLYAQAVEMYMNIKDLPQNERKLWIWEPEFREMERKHQKQFKKAKTDPVGEILGEFLSHKWELTDGMFRTQDEFNAAMNELRYGRKPMTGELPKTIEMETDMYIPSKGTGMQYITKLPLRWVNEYFRQSNLSDYVRSNERIRQSLESNDTGYTVRNRLSYKFLNMNMDCIVNMDYLKLNKNSK